MVKRAVSSPRRNASLAFRLERLQKFRYGVPPFQKVPVWCSGAFRLSLSTGKQQIYIRWFCSYVIYFLCCCFADIAAIYSLPRPGLQWTVLFSHDCQEYTREDNQNCCMLCYVQQVFLSLVWAILKGELGPLCASWIQLFDFPQIVFLVVNMSAVDRQYRFLSEMAHYECCILPLVDLTYTYRTLGSSKCAEL